MARENLILYTSPWYITLVVLLLVLFHLSNIILCKQTICTRRKKRLILGFFFHRGMSLSLLPVLEAVRKHRSLTLYLCCKLTSRSLWLLWRMNCSDTFKERHDRVNRFSSTLFVRRTVLIECLLLHLLLLCIQKRMRGLSRHYMAGVANTERLNNP